MDDACERCHRTPAEYAENRREFQQQRGRFYTPRLVERFVAENHPYEFCDACGEGQKSREQMMADIIALHETTIRIPLEEEPAIAPNVRGPRTTPRSSTRVGRNEPCPCKSGKKYKKCCART